MLSQFDIVVFAVGLCSCAGLTRFRGHGASHFTSKQADFANASESKVGTLNRWESQKETCAASNEDEKACAGEPQCFPHYECDESNPCQPTCLPAQAVQCRLGEEGSKKLMLFLSDGLSNSDLKRSFKHLVSELLLSSSHDFKDQPMFHGLKALVISDACFFKRFETDPWPCEDFKTSLVEMGFESDLVSSMFLTDLILEGKQDKATLEERLSQLNNAQGTEIIDTETPAALVKYGETIDAHALLDGVHVVAVNGGNPDYVTFVLTRVAPQLAALIRSRVEEGTLVFMGRSAGAMVGGKDVGLTTEPTPSVTDSLLGCRKGVSCENGLQGIGLAGICSIRPHYSAAWDVASEIYERVEGINVVRIPNGEGMMCTHGACKMAGCAHNVIHGADKQQPPTYEPIKDVVPHHEGAEAHTSERRFCVDCGQGESTAKSRAATATCESALLLLGSLTFSFL